MIFRREATSGDYIARPSILPVPLVQLACWLTSDPQSTCLSFISCTKEFIGLFKFYVSFP